MQIVRFVFFFLLFCGVGCSKKDATYYRYEAGKVQVAIYSELSKVHTLQDLLERQETLSFLFDQLAEDAVQAASMTRQQVPLDEKSQKINQQLMMEMGRVLLIPGAQTVIEVCQESGLEKIDAFEKGILPRTL